MSPQRKGLLSHPSRTIALGFFGAIAAGTLLLLLPFSTAAGEHTSVLTAAFTSTSAVCVTGLIVVDTSTHWTGFGQVVIAVLIQLGGLGIMSFATLVALVVSRRMRLTSRLVARSETGTLDLGDLRRVLRNVVGFSALFEGAAALMLAFRLWTGYDRSPLDALGQGSFHAVSAFNNAGFSLYSDNLAGFVTDWFFCLVVMLAVILGGIGFPVMLELKRSLRAPRRWSVHTKLTLATTAVLLVVGSATITMLEWDNAETIGALDAQNKVLAGSFQAVMPRTAGFNTVDVGAMKEPSLLVTDGLMFVGGGSASTAGGIKVTTFALLALVIWAELRGERDVVWERRRFPDTVQREALAIALVGVAAIMSGTLVLMLIDDFPTSSTFFETFSAFGTVGLSTGITPSLSGVGKAVLILMMFIGRIGPLTFGTALVLRRRERRFRFPEERPLVG